MAFNYDWSALSTDLAQVRLNIGDTDVDGEHLLQDEEINHYLGIRANVPLASIDCVRAIIAKLSKENDRSNLQFSASRSQKVTQYRDLLKDLEAESFKAVGATLTGASFSQKDSTNADTDYIQSENQRDQNTKKRNG